MNVPISYNQLYQEAVRKLSSSGLSNAENEVMWILEETIGLTRLMIHTSPDHLVSIQDQQFAWQFLDRRASGEPIQYVMGTQEFWGLEFVVPRGVLIPRLDSELLIHTILPYVEDSHTSIVVDVGTGTGCLAVAFGMERPQARILATDRSLLAIRTARKNAARHHVIHQMKFCVGDLLAPLLSQCLEGKVAGIIANLPYISHEEWEQLPREVREFEPALALDGGPDGLMPYRRLLQQGRVLLAPRGVLVLEVGRGQSSTLCQEVKAEGSYTVREIRHDALDIERVVCLERKE